MDQDVVPMIVLAGGFPDVVRVASGDDVAFWFSLVSIVADNDNPKPKEAAGQN